MRKVLIMFTATMMVVVMPISAQNKKTKPRESLTKKVNKLWNKTKKSVENAGHELGDAIGFEDRVTRESDLVKVDGKYYMPIYKVNLYNSADANEYCDICKKKFKTRYPAATIQSVVIPQASWTSKPVMKNDEVKGYDQTLYCYVLARDGSDGYIYAKFIFERTKDVGGTYSTVSNKWGAWVRTDVITNVTYTKLLEK